MRVLPPSWGLSVAPRRFRVACVVGRATLPHGVRPGAFWGVSALPGVTLDLGPGLCDPDVVLTGGTDLTDRQHQEDGAEHDAGAYRYGLNGTHDLALTMWRAYRAIPAADRTPRTPMLMMMFMPSA